MADLIERYKITANLPSVLMNYCNRFNSKQLESITEMIYELENSIESADVQPVNQWISVKDKLPDVGKLVIVCDKQGGVGAMELLSNGKWYSNGMAWSAEWIIYWQPLPEPPKDGDAE